MAQQTSVHRLLRVGVVGGGCSGFSYHLALVEEESATDNDNVYEFNGLKSAGGSDERNVSGWYSNRLF